MSFGAAGTREVAQMLQEQLPLVDLIKSLGGWEFPLPTQTGGCCSCHFWENSKQTHAILNSSYTQCVPSFLLSLDRVCKFGACPLTSTWGLRGRSMPNWRNRLAENCLTTLLSVTGQLVLLACLCYGLRGFKSVDGQSSSAVVGVVRSMRFQKWLKLGWERERDSTAGTTWTSEGWEQRVF